MKETINKTKRQCIEWKKIFTGLHLHLPLSGIKRRLPTQEHAGSLQGHWFVGISLYLFLLAIASRLTLSIERVIQALFISGHVFHISKLYVIASIQDFVQLSYPWKFPLLLSIPAVHIQFKKYVFFQNHDTFWFKVLF